METYQVEGLLALSERDLLIMIGSDVASEESRFFPPDSGELIKKATEWLNTKHAHLQSVVCSNNVVISFYKKDDLVALIVAIADLIASLCVNVSPFSVAALITKKGVSVLCENVWEPADVTQDKGRQ